MIHINHYRSKKRAFRPLWIILSIIGGILLLSCAGYIILNILAPPLNAAATSNAYYQAIEHKDYTKAYSYLSPNYPVGGHERLSQAIQPKEKILPLVQLRTFPRLAIARTMA